MVGEKFNTLLISSLLLVFFVSVSLFVLSLRTLFFLSTPVLSPVSDSLCFSFLALVPWVVPILRPRLVRGGLVHARQSNW